MLQNIQEQAKESNSIKNTKQNNDVSVCLDHLDFLKCVGTEVLYFPSGTYTCSIHQALFDKLRKKLEPDDVQEINCSDNCFFNFVLKEINVESQNLTDKTCHNDVCIVDYLNLAITAFYNKTLDYTYPYISLRETSYRDTISPVPKPLHQVQNSHLDDKKYLEISELKPECVMRFSKSIKYNNGCAAFYGTTGMILPRSPSHSNKESKPDIETKGDTKSDAYHIHCGFNKFTKQSYPIPSKEMGWMPIHDELSKEYKNLSEEYEKYPEHYREKKKKTLDEYMAKGLKRHLEWVSHCICDPCAKYFVPLSQESHPLNQDIFENFKQYRTLDNYGIGFVVLIGKHDESDLETVYVYGRTQDLVNSSYNNDPTQIFVNQIKKYDALEIFLGTSPKNQMTEFSGGYGIDENTGLDKWLGNSILLRIRETPKADSVMGSTLGNFQSNDEFFYAQIGTDVFEFKTNERIIKYVSSVGNNCVPYPYAESENWCYCMSSCAKTPVMDHPDREINGDVSYVKGAKYESFPTTIIAGRGTESERYILNYSDDYDDYLKELEQNDSNQCKSNQCDSNPCESNPCESNPCKSNQSKITIFPGQQVKLMKNTCSDTRLPAVRQINEILSIPKLV